MKIAINLLQLAPGRTEGVTTYVRELIRHFASADNATFVVFHQNGLEIDDLKADNIALVPRPKPSGTSRLWSRVLRTLGLRTSDARTQQLKDYLAKHQVDMIHYPFSTIPASDFSLEHPIVLSVMDLQHEYFPELFTAIDLLNRRQSFQSSAERADHVIAISDYTKQTLAEKFKLSPDKISVTHLAATVSTHPANTLKLPEDFMYYPAGDWKHKNHLKLFEAMKLLKDQGLHTKLILTGVTSPNYDNLIETIDKLGLAEDVSHLGQVSFDEVAQIYHAARMLVYPSLFEGFGLPPLEALSVGLPVASSNTTSVPEIVGDAAVQFDPSDAAAIAAGIRRVWSDETLRAKLIKAGYKQAKQFSWEATAKQTLSIYNQVYEAKS